MFTKEKINFVHTPKTFEEIYENYGPEKAVAIVAATQAWNYAMDYCSKKVKDSEEIETEAEELFRWKKELGEVPQDITFMSLIDDGMLWWDKGEDDIDLYYVHKDYMVRVLPKEHDTYVTIQKVSCCYIGGIAHWVVESECGLVMNFPKEPLKVKIFKEEK